VPGEPCGRTESPQWFAGCISDRPSRCCRVCYDRSRETGGASNFRCCLDARALVVLLTWDASPETPDQGWQTMLLSCSAVFMPALLMCVRSAAMPKSTAWVLTCAGPCEALLGEACGETQSPRWYSGLVTGESRACCQSCYDRWRRR
jgi:hypothetical protein